MLYSIQNFETYGTTPTPIQVEKATTRMARTNSDVLRLPEGTGVRASTYL